jgi:hypothetical protein
MAEITTAVDETAATDLLHVAEAQYGMLHQSPTNASLGPFTVTYSADATLSGGTVDLIPPDIVRVASLRADWSATIAFSFDLSDFLPDIHIPQVCVHIPCVGNVCTPRIDIDWPVVDVGPLTISDFATTTADLRLEVVLDGGTWRVNVVIDGVPALQLGPKTAAILTAIGLAISAALMAVPFIGPFLAAAVAAITAVIGISAVTGLLGKIISPFLSGRRFQLGEFAREFVVLPASGLNDPQVDITLDTVTAAVAGSDEDELVVSIDVSP